MNKKIADQYNNIAEEVDKMAAAIERADSPDSELSKSNYAFSFLDLPISPETGGEAVSQLRGLARTYRAAARSVKNRSYEMEA
jgi:hypothetical protein